MSDPKCETCGMEITTGLMAVFCPRNEKCQFWPEDKQSQDFIAFMRTPTPPTFEEPR
jgi:hypothetical protein